MISGRTSITSIGIQSNTVMFYVPSTGNSPPFTVKYTEGFMRPTGVVDQTRRPTLFLCPILESNQDYCIVGSAVRTRYGNCNCLKQKTVRTADPTILPESCRLEVVVRPLLSVGTCQTTAASAAVDPRSPTGHFGLSSYRHWQSQWHPEAGRRERAIRGGELSERTAQGKHSLGIQVVVITDHAGSPKSHAGRVAQVVG